MPYKDPKKHCAYNAERIQTRRKKWFDKNGPCKNCNSEEDLQVDHINPATKISHRIWSWRDEKREKELEKCQVLCKKCHEEKNSQYFASIRQHGKLNTYRRHHCRCELCILAMKENNKIRGKKRCRKKRII